MRRYIPLVLLLVVFGARQSASAQDASISRDGSRSSSFIKRITISSIPDSAELFIDSTLVGLTPVEVPLSAGPHTLRLVHADTSYEPLDALYYVQDQSPATNLKIRLIRKYVLVTFLPSEPQDELFVEDSRVDIGTGAKSSLHHGNYRAEARNVLSGRSVRQEISFPPGAEYEVRARLGHFSYIPILSSIILPGLGQLNDHAMVEAGGFFLASAASAYFYFVSTRAFEDAHADYNSVIQMYNNAATESEAAALRTRAGQLQADVESKRSTQNLAVALFVGVYLSNLLDVILFHARDDDIQVSVRPLETPGTGGRGRASISLSVRLRFPTPN